jgi:hypothetical protein
MSVTTTNDDTLVGPSASHQSVPHQVNRLIFDAGQPYEKFLSRFEAVVPPMDPRLPLDRAWRHARWPGIVPEAAASPPGTAMNPTGPSVSPLLAGWRPSDRASDSREPSVDIDRLSRDVVAGR